MVCTFGTTDYSTHSAPLFAIPQSNQAEAVTLGLPQQLLVLLHHRSDAVAAECCTLITALTQILQGRQAIAQSQGVAELTNALRRSKQVRTAQCTTLLAR